MSSRKHGAQEVRYEHSTGCLFRQPYVIYCTYPDKMANDVNSYNDDAPALISCTASSHRQQGQVLSKQVAQKNFKKDPITDGEVDA